MEVTARLSNLRIAPRKTRLAADLIRGKDVLKAQAILSFTVSKPGKAILKLLNSAVASAKHNHQLDEKKLFVSKITVDEGPKLKRWHPMSRGRAYPIMKRTSHIVLVLSEKNGIEKTTVKQENNNSISKSETKNKKEKTKKVSKPKKNKKIKNKNVA